LLFKVKTIFTLLNSPIFGEAYIQHDSELRLYYKRKLAEGKDKMLAINNVRNKLIARAFAVVKRGTPYVVLQQHAA